MRRRQKEPSSQRNRAALGLGLLVAVVAAAACADENPIDDSVPDSDYCSGVADWDDDWLEFENEVLRLTNQARSSGTTCGGESRPAVGDLEMVPELRCSSRVHSKDMAEQGFFMHDSLDGTSPFERMNMAGYEYSNAGENIAFGYQTPQDVVQGWLDSPGHCNNMMNGSFTEIGVGFHGEGSYWTQNFGAPRG